ncbi:hypothetical protein N431DRAFT_440567 [Stipitochalara longipes BDJ]|nr:hypothetical protein N431DRAFT_440567 [Stipitochalara longipes BDJ]
MDPMDFTMDEASHHSPNTHRHQCQPSQSSPNANPFAPHARDGHPYDPVYDSSSWYQTNNVPSRAGYAAPENVQWGVSSFLPAPNWQGQGVAEGHSGGQEPSTFRQSRYMGVPWNEMRAFDASPFGFNSYGSPMNSNNSASESAPGASAQASAAAAAAASPRLPSTYGQEAHARSVQHAFQIYGQSRSNRFINPESTQRRPDDIIDRSLRPNQPMPFMEQRTSYPRASRQSHNHIPRNTAFDPPHPRRRAATHTWDSDDDEDPVPEMDAETYRRNAELLFSTDLDDERSMAAMRGALASGKRVPSKEALASLEIVKLEDLEENGRTCIICYNEFGISNPEGITENPIRLPKCKHVFGDKCIKKWFEDSDSCPYCRDKLPSELSVRKTLAYESYRAARREHMLAHQRARQGFALRYPFSEESGTSRTSTSIPMQRAQDEYELAMARNVDSWGYSPPSRSTADSPESRRRQARGRIGSSRAAHLLGRPTSVGSASARWINPASNYGNPPQRGTNAPSINNTPRRSVTPGLPRQNSGSSSGSTPQTPPRNRALSGPSSSPPAEEASPPVAVGSGLPRDRQGEPALRRSFDIFTNPTSADWNSDPLNFMLNSQDPDHFNLGSRSRPHSNDPGNSSFQTLLDSGHPLGQNPPSGTSLDSSRPQQGQGDLDRSGNVDDQILRNPLPRWSR